MNWYLHVLSQYSVFEGRAHRAEYWWFTLFNTLALIVLLVFDAVFGLFNMKWGLGLTSTVYTFATLIPTLAVTVRRLHDTNKNGWWVLLTFVPLVGGVVLFAFMVMRGDPRINDYGKGPAQHPAHPWSHFFGHLRF